VVVHALTPNIQEVEAAGSRPAWVTWWELVSTTKQNKKNSDILEKKKQQKQEMLKMKNAINQMKNSGRALRD
jgi:hypothetical protein